MWASKRVQRRTRTLELARATRRPCKGSQVSAPDRSPASQPASLFVRSFVCSGTCLRVVKSKGQLQMVGPICCWIAKTRARREWPASLQRMRELPNSFLSPDSNPIGPPRGPAKWEPDKLESKVRVSQWRTNRPKMEAVASSQLIDCSRSSARVLFSAKRTRETGRV